MAGAVESHEPQLILGNGVRGYRLWKVNGSWLLPTVIRAALLNGETDLLMFPPEGPYRASCWNLGTSIAHRTVPEATCHCGFYALYAAPAFRTLIVNGHANPRGLAEGDWVLGSVRMSGVVIKGDAGVMRAQKMEIEALVSIDAMHGLQVVADRYHVPLIEPHELLCDFPLDNANQRTNEVDSEAFRLVRSMLHMLHYPAASRPHVNAYAYSMARLLRLSGTGL